jgi:hypothetical protein
MESRHEATVNEKPPRAEGSTGIGFWTLVFAMFLFPFFFHAGTELYMMARAALFPGQTVKKQEEPKADAGKLADGKSLDKLAAALAEQTKALQEGAGRVVIIHPPLNGTFSFDAEKTKIYELSGINMDDPAVSGANKLAQVKSVELLYSLMESFDRIVVNAAQNNVSDFHVKNAIEWKKRALKRLQELK